MKRLRGKLAKEIDIKLVKKRIEDLNDLIGTEMGSLLILKLLAGEHDIVKDRDGAYKFKVLCYLKAIFKLTIIHREEIQSISKNNRKHHLQNDNYFFSNEESEFL